MWQYRGRTVEAAVAVCAVLGLASCGGGPAAPSNLTPNVAAPVVTAAMLTAAPVSPVNGASIDIRSSPVALVAAVPAPPAGALIVDTFEIDDNPEFSSPVMYAMVRESGSTSIMSSDPRVGRSFYWRVRASSGEQAGPYSAVSRFSVPVELLRAPLLLGPLPGSIESSRPSLSIKRVQYSTDPLDRSWSFEFEISRNQSFSDIVERPRIPPGSNAASVKPSADLADGHYFWRARTIDDGGRASAFSDPWAFEVSVPFAATPMPISPAPGATVTQPVSLVLNAGRVFDDHAQIEAQLSSTASFDIIITSPRATAVNGSETAVYIGTRPAGTYYWRARTILLATSTRAEIVSGWTEPRSVVLAGEALALGRPDPLKPGYNETTGLRPTLIVRNVSRNRPVASLLYRFEIAPDFWFAQSPVALGVVAEGNGTTEWTVPFDLPVGVKLEWRVQAQDPVTGTTSEYSAPWNLTAVDSRAHLYTLAFVVPPSCGFAGPGSGSPTTFYAQSDTAIGGPHFRLVAADALTSTFEDMALDLNISGNGALSGTLVGVAHGPNHYYFVSSQDGTGPALVTGTAGGNGLSGHFTGRLVESSDSVSKSTDKTCTSSIAWTVLPR